MAKARHGEGNNHAHLYVIVREKYFALLNVRSKIRRKEEYQICKRKHVFKLRLCKHVWSPAYMKTLVHKGRIITKGEKGKIPWSLHLQKLHNFQHHRCYSLCVSCVTKSQKKYLRSNGVKRKRRFWEGFFSE